MSVLWLPEFAAGGRGERLSVDDAVLVVHHLLELLLVVRIDGNDADVAHGAELTAVVQVLVLQPKEVPHEPPAYNTPQKQSR